MFDYGKELLGRPLSGDGAGNDRLYGRKNDCVPEPGKIGDFADALPDTENLPVSLPSPFYFTGY